MSWIDYWNTDTSIYVNDRHKAVHYERIAADLAPYAGSGRRVLDYGCGEAMSAGRLAAHCARLYLYDAAPRVRASLVSRFRDVANIEVLPDAGLAALPPASVDLIVLNSVMQYVSPPDRDILFGELRGKLAPGGTLLLGDLVTPQASIVTDTLALLRFAAANGFFLAALAGLVRTFFSDYRAKRAALGLATYSFDEIADVLRKAGFSASRAARNIGHNDARMTVLAKPLAAPAA